MLQTVQPLFKPGEPHARAHGLLRRSSLPGVPQQIVRQHAQVQGEAQRVCVSAVREAVRLQVRADQAHEEAGKQAFEAEVRQYFRSRSSERK